MSLVFQSEQYYIPIKLINSTKEKTGVKHGFYVCEKCQKPELTKFCSNCKSETNAILFYPETKEDVGSRDLWDIVRINLNELKENEITKYNWIEEAEIKKPKASEMEKFRETKEKVGKSPDLKDLFYDMVNSKTVFKGKIVLRGKVNEIYFKPAIYNGFATIEAGITDGNKETVEPKLKIELKKKEKPVNA